MRKVAIVGATGYSGAELCALSARHPGVEIAAVFSSGKKADAAPFERLHPSLVGRTGPDLAPFTLDRLVSSGAELAFLATPNETSAEIGPELVGRGIRIIDIAGAFRLRDASAYPRWYGFAHPAPELLAEAVYGLTEWCGPELASARVVANPGCYPTSVLLALKPSPFGALKHEEKKAFVDYCKKKSGSSIRIHDERSHGYRCPPLPSGIIAALSFYGDGIDDAYAEKLLFQGIRDTLLDNLAMEQVAGSQGGFADGTCYIFQLGGTFNPFLALSIATGSDFFFEHEILAKLPDHLLYAMLPFGIKRIGWNNEARYFATFHDNWTLTAQEYGSAGQYLANMIAVTAAEYRRHGNEKTARLYSWFLKEAFGGIPYQAENPVSFVLMDWSIPPHNPKELGLPPSVALGWDEEKGQVELDPFGKKAGIGWVAMRSARDNPDATFAIFKVEPFYYHGHMHHDSLAFMIAKGEELALARAGNYMCWYEGGALSSRDPGWPQMGNFFSRTISSNNILVYDPEEKFDGWANDGGQRLVPYWDKTWGRTYNGTENANYRDIGGLIRFERGDNYVYPAADATRAYNSTLVTTRQNRPKVKLIQREFVFELTEWRSRLLCNLRPCGIGKARI